MLDGRQTPLPAAQARGGYLAALPLLYLATLCAITLVWFALAWAFRAVRPADRRIGVAATIRLLLDEMRAIGTVGPRMALDRYLMPTRRRLRPSLRSAVARRALQRGGDGRAAARSRRAEPGPVYALSYGPPLASIDVFADQAAAKMDAHPGGDRRGAGRDRRPQHGPGRWRGPICAGTASRRRPWS